MVARTTFVRRKIRAQPYPAYETRTKFPERNLTDSAHKDAYSGSLLAIRWGAARSHSASWSSSISYTPRPAW
jgi:hypothetical protein